MTTETQPIAEVVLHPRARRAIEAAEHPSVIARARTLADADLAFAFAMFAPMLFLLQLGAKGAALFVLATFAYAIWSWRRLGSMIAPGLLLLIPAGVACLSLVWSDMAKETLKHGLELGVTLFAAVLLSTSRRPDMVLRGIASAFFVYLVVALAFGRTTSIAGVDTAFSGLSASKNLLADIAATGLIVSLGAAWLSLRSRAWWWAAAMAGAAVLALAMTLMAKSAGAVLALGVGIAAIAALALLRALPIVMRGLSLWLLAMVTLPVAVFHRQITDFAVQYVSAAFDKDPTLTGRTYIWSRGWELIRERPWLGQGYGTFWVQGNPDAEGLWRFAGVKNRGGFTFHNTVVEVLVQLGWVGLTILGLVMGIAIMALAVRFVRTPTRLLCIWGGVLIYELMRMPIESIGYSPFIYSTVLITAALAMAFSPPFEPQPQVFLRPRPPRWRRFEKRANRA